MGSFGPPDLVLVALIAKSLSHQYEDEMESKAPILMISDGRRSAEEAGRLLREAGHRVALCGGGLVPYAACPLLKAGSCPVAEAAGVIIFALAPLPQTFGRSYGGAELLKAYRSHPYLSKVPMVLVSDGHLGDVAGEGPVEFVGASARPKAIASAAERLCAGLVTVGG